MLSFLFWNMKSDNVAALSGLVKEHDVDVLILAECPILPAAILERLNLSRLEYFYDHSDCSKIQLFTRFPDEFVVPVMKTAGEPLVGDDFSIRRLLCPNREEILLCSVHFPYRLRQERIDQTAYTFRFAELIADAEDAAGHARTVLVGGWDCWNNP